MDSLLWRRYCIELKDLGEKKHVVNENIKKVIIQKSGKLQICHFTVCRNPWRRASHFNPRPYFCFAFTFPEWFHQAHMEGYQMLFMIFLRMHQGKRKHTNTSISPKLWLQQKPCGLSDVFGADTWRCLRRELTFNDQTGSWSHCMNSPPSLQSQTVRFNFKHVFTLELMPA